MGVFDPVGVQVGEDVDVCVKLAVSDGEAVVEEDCEIERVEDEVGVSVFENEMDIVGVVESVVE